MDLILLVVYLFLVSAVIGVLAQLPIVAWLRREWQLMRARTWTPPEPNRQPFTVGGDPKVAAMVARQRFYGRHLRRKGRSLFSGKPYTPVLTKPAEQPAEQPAPNNAVPLRRATNTRSA